MTQAFPLQWPTGWQRSRYPTRSQFKAPPFGEARDKLYRELELLGAKSVVLSSDMPLRLDGIPRAARSEPADKGVAVYFLHKGKQLVMACDRWDRIVDNIRALQHSIAAIRGIDRWGCSSFLDRAFSGFKALPDTKKDWWDVLDVPQGSHPDTVREKYRMLARAAHPDLSGGDGSRMAEINRAFDEWKQSQ